MARPRRREPLIEIKTPEQIRHMRRAGLVVADILARLSVLAVEGTTPRQLDQVARDMLAAAEARSSFLGYQGFPAVTCISVNEEIVHGIPGDRPLAAGDTVSIDFGAWVTDPRGTQWHGDSAVTVLVGGVDPAVERLSEATRAAMWAGIAAAQPGGRLGDVCAAVETEALRRGSADGIAYGIVEGYTGHGIGTQMHMDPSVPNRGRAGRGMVLKPGTCIAIEPMLTLGRRHTRLMPDDWTVVTLDGAPAAHWEHTVAVTPEGPWVLTARDGGRAALRALRVPCGAPTEGA